MTGIRLTLLQLRLASVLGLLLILVGCTGNNKIISGNSNAINGASPDVKTSITNGTFTVSYTQTPVSSSVSNVTFTMTETAWQMAAVMFEGGIGNSVQAFTPSNTYSKAFELDNGTYNVTIHAYPQAVGNSATLAMTVTIGGSSAPSPTPIPTVAPKPTPISSPVSTPKPSSTPSPTPTKSISGVSVAPSANLQALVNQYPAGTTFVLAQGVHNDSVTTIKSGDIFTSPSGTTADGVIESGAKPLTGWKQVTIGGVSYWTTAGGTPKPYTYGAAECESDFQGCYYTQDLYFNSADYTHVTSLAKVTSGSWFYDFSGSVGPVNNIYLINNPIGQTVELGVLEFAFESATATNVTIQGLIVEKYAPMLLEGAIETLAANWLIQNNEVLLNHGEGIQPKPGNENTRILHNYAHDNGDMGIGGGSINGGTISYNTIYHNNLDHVLSGWGAGGFKTGGSVNLMVSYNIVYDNLGNGMHADVFSNGVTFDHNTVYGNLGEGIRCEISDNCTITNNIVYGNEPNPNEPGTTHQIQIAYASSSHGIIENNIVVTSASTAGIVVGYSTARLGCSATAGACTKPVGMSVSNNTIYSTSATGSALEDTSSPSTASSWEVSGIFNKNTYCVSSLPFSSASWLFSTAAADYNNVTFNVWQSEGQDANGSVAVVGSAACPGAP